MKLETRCVLCGCIVSVTGERSTGSGPTARSAPPDLGLDPPDPRLFRPYVRAAQQQHRGPEPGLGYRYGYYYGERAAAKAGEG